jgi:hypothetical protein
MKQVLRLKIIESRLQGGLALFAGITALLASVSAA